MNFEDDNDPPYAFLPQDQIEEVLATLLTSRQNLRNRITQLIAADAGLQSFLARTGSTLNVSSFPPHPHKPELERIFELTLTRTLARS